MPLKRFLALSNSPWHVLQGMHAKYHPCPSSAKLLLRGFESFWLYFPVIMVFLSHSLRITSMDRFSKSYAFASQVPSAVAQFFSDNSLPLTHSEIIIPILDDFLIIRVSFELCEIFACHPIVFLAKWE